MIEFYKYLYAGSSAARRPYKYQKYIPEMEKPNKRVQLSSCPANFTPVLEYTYMRTYVLVYPYTYVQVHIDTIEFLMW